jgi:hypothetical protein
LLAAEHVAGAAEFEVKRGDLEAGAEIGELLEVSSVSGGMRR